MRHLSIRARLTIILVTFLIPIGVLSIQFINELNKNIASSERELKGVLYTKPMLKLMNEIADYQVTVLVRNSGDAEAQKELDEGEAKIAGLLDDLSSNYALLGEDLALTPEKLAEHNTEFVSADTLKSKWNTIINSSYKEASYHEILRDLENVIEVVGKNSGMVLDPELDTNALVTSIMYHMPRMLYELGDAKAKGFELLLKNGNMIPTDKRGSFVAPLIGMKNYVFPAIEDSVTTSIKEDGYYNGVSVSLKNNLEPAFKTYATQSQHVFELMGSLFNGGSVDAAKYVEVLDVMHDGTADIGDVIIPELQKLVEIRISNLEKTRNYILSFITCIVTLSIVGFCFISINLSKSIAHIVSALTKIADGNTDEVIKTDEGKDEVSRLNKAAEKLRVSVAEVYMLKQMVQDMPMNVITLDVKKDCKINYVNNSTLKTLEDFAGTLPVKPREIIGQPMDVLYENPLPQRAIIADAANLPNRTKIRLGAETIDQRISAICNKKGEYIGAMVTWNIVTAYEKLANDFEHDVKSIVNMVASASTELSNTAESLAHTVKENQQKTDEASSAAFQTTTNVQSIASASEELSTSVKEISVQMEKANMLAQRSSEKAVNADKLAEELKRASTKVSEVIDFISKISAQINLLALNATIESARAGDAGKGFSIVAGEVKNLANQTDKSVAEIQNVTNQMGEASEAIINALFEIKSSITEISSATSNVYTAVEEQSSATNEISKNMHIVSTSTQLISTNLENVSNISASVATASEQLLSSSRGLSQQAEMLNTQVDAFLMKVRA